MKPKNWRLTEQNGVNAWPNASIWMRDELRSKVRILMKLGMRLEVDAVEILASKFLAVMKIITKHHWSHFHWDNVYTYHTVPI